MKVSGLYKLVLLVVVALLLTQCQQGNNQETVYKKPDMPIDTIAVTSFSYERENSAALKDWQIFQDGNEVITLPPDWKSAVKDQALILTPTNNYGHNEGLTFKRFDREGHANQEDDMLAQKTARAAFSNFTIQGGDSLKKLVFQRDFAYERNAVVSKNGNNYKAYCLVYVDDSTFYKYNLVLSEQRVSSYKDNLLSDIIGNLKINNNYFLRTDNPLKEIINIKL